MTFDEILDAAIGLLRKRGRVTYRTLRRQFELDDETLGDLKFELITGQKLAVDEGGEVLVWVGVGAPEPAASPTASGVYRALSLPGDAPRAERRQITILFCDVVGSTELAHQLDPEDLRELIGAYQLACDGAIRGLDGYIAQYLGDGVLAYFGWPIAHEAAAERAVRAAMACIEAVRSAGTGVSRARGIQLSARIGLHTGMVVVGEVGAGGGRQTLALGEAPNVAARLQATAASDAVVMSESTYRLVKDRFECADDGTHALKGIGPTRVFHVLGVSTTERRHEVRAMVGRKRELATVLEAWRGAQRGHGGVVLVSGEAGIGKSCLISAVRDAIAQPDMQEVVFHCSPYHTNTALHPISEQIERRLGLRRDDRPDHKLAAIEHALGRTRLAAPARAVPLCASLLGVPSPGHPPLNLSPQRHKQETLDLLAAWLADDARRAPVLVIWDDLHWADATTLELAGALLGRAASMRALHILTYRPEFEPPWPSRPETVDLRLTRLGAAQVGALVGRMTSGRTLAPELLALIAEKTDGVPLFVEEVTKLLLESGLVHEVDGRFEPTGPIAQLIVPATLHDSLMARLDRMSAAREIAQLGATIGREFAWELMRAVCELDEPSLEHSLAQLCAAELLFERQRPRRFLFKHALIQDVAYQSLVRATRQQYHERIAVTLEGAFPAIAERSPELLGFHWSQAGDHDRAVPHLHRAGERAIAQSAYVEAVGHFRRALEELRELPDSAERARRELDLQLALGVPLTATKGYGALEVREAYARARALSDQVGDPRQVFPSVYGLFRSSLLRAEYVPSSALGEQLLSLATRSASLPLGVAAHRSIGSVLFYMGEFARSDEHLDRVFGAPVSPLEVRKESMHYEVVDSYVTANGYRAWNAWMRGDGEMARRTSDLAVEMAVGLDNGFTTALALSFAAWLHQFRRDPVAARARVEAALELARQQALEMWVGWGHVIEGWVLGEEGHPGAAVELMRRGIDEWQATGSALGMSYFLTLLAQGYGRIGEAERGLAVLEQADAFSRAHEERFYRPEICRVRAELLALGRAPDRDVEHWLGEATREARAIGARPLLLRAAVTLARRRDDAVPQVRDALAAVGDDASVDVQDARAIILAG